MKRILTIQDISCVGRCSLTIALPIISAIGIETAVIPTAVLSTHTAFNDYTFTDLTKTILPTTQHWKKQGIDFDGIYTGYLGSCEQFEIISKVFDDFKKEDSLIFIDPVMADFGELYSGFTTDFVHAMKDLCKKADILTPNLTEACLLTNTKFIKDGYDIHYIKEILRKLSMLGAKKIILTGISFDENLIGAISYDSQTGEFFEYYNERFPQHFHGTGDIFASTLFATLIKGYELQKALKIAVDFTADAIRQTLTDENARWYGVSFEKALPNLIKLTQENT